VTDAKAPPAPTNANQPAPKSLGRRLLFILFVLSPLAVLAVLCWMIAVAIPRGPQMANDHRGAGGGDTGGANAIGEMLEKK
jgi:hypothetical protein